jgi:hypothetical protein
MADVFVRGSTVFFDIVFKDENGSTINPSGATLTISYPKKAGGGRASTELAMTAGGGFEDGWGPADGWDSRNAGQGAVYAHARTDGNPPVSSEDFEFQLEANPANVAAND